MKNFTNRIAGIATLALAILPAVALATGAHAETSVRIADLNLATAAGQAAFTQRVNHAASAYCGDQKVLQLRAACEAGVRAEVTEKLSVLAQRGQVQLARN